MPKPNLSIDELNEARRRSGNLGGRPRHPTVAEARLAKLDELLPKSLRVIDESLDSENETIRLRAAEYVYDQAKGKAVQAIRTEADASRSSPFDALSEADKELAISAARARLASLTSSNGTPSE